MMRCTLIVLLVAAMLLGCSRGPSAIKPPRISGTDAAEAALGEFDKNGDGVIGSEELELAPGLRAGLAAFDTNGDKLIDGNEIKSRVAAWRDSKVGLITIRCDVTLNDMPLEGAQVIFDPAKFLGDQVQAAVGTTDRFGTAYMSIPKSKRPAPDAPAGVQFGLYYVRVSKIVDGKDVIPARYNTSTEIGQEISHDDPGVANGIRYELSNY
jgi:hypothetical protein